MLLDCRLIFNGLCKALGSVCFSPLFLFKVAKVISSSLVFGVKELALISLALSLVVTHEFGI